MITKTILTTAYFPPISYFHLIKEHPSITIEQYEHYGKQSYRNRCAILAANGPLTLSIPVIKATNSKVLTKDVLIDYSTQWQKIHSKSIESAYRNSPFYDYYIDDILPFFEKEEKYLLDLNTKATETIASLIGLDLSIDLTEDYFAEYDKNTVNDLRDAIHPKQTKRKGNFHYQNVPYIQTFADRFPFIEDLSILDLLFNEGPEAVQYI